MSFILYLLGMWMTYLFSAAVNDEPDIREFPFTALLAIIFWPVSATISLVVAAYFIATEWNV